MVGRPKILADVVHEVASVKDDVVADGGEDWVARLVRSAAPNLWPDITTVFDIPDEALDWSAYELAQIFARSGTPVRKARTPVLR